GQVLWVAALVPPWRRPRPLGRWEWLEVGGVSLLLAGLLALRLWNNGEFPLNFHGDSASTALQARQLLAGGYPDFFGVGWADIPLLGYWPTAISLRLFGDSLAGLNSISAFEAVIALLGLYLIVRDLFGWRPALFALVLAGTDLTFLHFSRVVPY